MDRTLNTDLAKLKAMRDILDLAASIQNFLSERNEINFQATTFKIWIKS